MMGSEVYSTPKPRDKLQGLNRDIDNGILLKNATSDMSALLKPRNKIEIPF